MPFALVNAPSAGTLDARRLPPADQTMAVDQFYTTGVAGRTFAHSMDGFRRDRRWLSFDDQLPFGGLQSQQPQSVWAVLALGVNRLMVHAD